MSSKHPTSKRGKRSTLGTIVLIIATVAVWWFNQQKPSNDPPQSASATAIVAKEPQVAAASDATETPETEEPIAAPTAASPTGESATAKEADRELSSVESTPASADEPTSTTAPTSVPATVKRVTATPIPKPTDTPTPAPRGPPGMRTITLDKLPPEAVTTINLIWQNGPFPYRQDDSTFQNREGRLPNKPRGYYREFTVETPGLNHRGPRRIIEGEDGELYYTDDHYDSFYWVEAE